MDTNLKNQIDGLWKTWDNTSDETMEKDKISAEIAKFLIQDINLEKIAKIETEDELDEIVDIAVECNATSEKLLLFYQTIFPKVVDEADSFKDKVILLQDRLNKRTYPGKNETEQQGTITDNQILEKGEKKTSIDWKFFIIIILLIFLVTLSGINLYYSLNIN